MYLLLIKIPGERNMFHGISHIDLQVVDLQKPATSGHSSSAFPWVNRAKVLSSWIRAMSPFD